MELLCLPKSICSSLGFSLNRVALAQAGYMFRNRQLAVPVNSLEGKLSSCHDGGSWPRPLRQALTSLTSPLLFSDTLLHLPRHLLSQDR